MIYLNYAELLHVAERAIGQAPDIRDPGLLEAALSRPRTTVFGEDAYSTLEDKAAALGHSIARNHALVDGNKRLSLAGLMAFFGVNGRRLTLTNDQAYDLIISISTGELNEVSTIADRLRACTEDRR